MTQKSSESIHQQQILWRRQKVLELAADGYSIREIGTTLKIPYPTIGKDILHLRAEAKQQIHEYITDQVPFEYKKTLAGLEGIIRQMSQIISKSTDNKEIMQASNIKMQALNLKMEMVSGANLVEEAIDLVERYQNHGGNQPRGNITQKDNVVTDDSGQTA